MVVSREDTAMTPAGMTFSTLAAWPAADSRRQA